MASCLVGCALDAPSTGDAPAPETGPITPTESAGTGGGTPDSNAGSGGPGGQPPDPTGVDTPVEEDVAADIDGDLLSIAHANGLFVAVGYDLAYPDDGEQTQGWIVTSEDGKRWTTRYREGRSLLHSVASDGQRWVAVGWSIWSTDDGFQRSRSVVVSNDGLDWSQATWPSDENPERVVWTGTEFLARADGSLWGSADGAHWERRALPMEHAHRLVVGAAGVALASDTALALSTDGGQSWDVSPSPEPSPGQIFIWPDGDGSGATWQASDTGEDGWEAWTTAFRWSADAGWTQLEVSGTEPLPQRVAHSGQRSAGASRRRSGG